MDYITETKEAENRELSTAEIEEVAGGMLLELALVHYLAYNKWKSEQPARQCCQ